MTKISQQVTRCPIYHSELCKSRQLNNKSRRISIYTLGCYVGLNVRKLPNYRYTNLCTVLRSNGTLCHPKPIWRHFYSAPQCSHCKRCTSYSISVCLSVWPSVRQSVTRRYCVETTARSTVQFALLDSKMCLVL